MTVPNKTTGRSAPPNRRGRTSVSPGDRRTALTVFDDRELSRDRREPDQETTRE
jgi:hypothetical protein